MKCYLQIPGLFLFIALFASAVLSGQGTVDYAKPKSYEIGQIDVEGAKFSDENAIIGVTGLKVGQIVDIPGSVVSDAIKKLSRLRLFDDISIGIDTVINENVVFLKINVQERPRYTSHEYVGVKKAYFEDLDNIIDDYLKRGSIATANARNNAANGIRQFYHDKGFLDAEVTIEETEDKRRTNAVKLIITVERNDKVKISGITFTGIPEMEDKKLKKQISPNRLIKAMEDTKPKTKLFAKSRYTRENFTTDKQFIIDYLNSLGFRDARLLGDSIWRDEKGGVNIRIDLDVGNQYYYRNITWKGNTLYDDATLTNVLGISKGDIYNAAEMEERLRFSLTGTDVSALYLDDGYLFFQVEPTEIAVENDSIDLEMRIYEGPQATIDKVIIRGNDRTHEHVIRRELRTVPGEKFSRTDIIRSQRQIINLGYFDPETLEINTPVNPQRGTVDIEYVVSERPSDQLELSAGWGGASGLIGTLGVTFNNFSARNMGKKDAWKPVPMGDGQRLSIRAQTNGSFYQSYNFSFTEPWLGGKKPNSFTFGAFYTKFTDQSQFDVAADGFLRIIRVFAGLGTRLKWPDDNFISNTTINIENIRLNDYGSFFKFDNRPVSTGNYNNYFIQQTFARTSINEPLFPRRGSKISLTVQLTPPYSLFREDNFWEIDNQSQQMLIEEENARRQLNGDPIMSESEADDFIFNEEVSRRFEFLEYHKWRFDAEWYTTLIGKLVFRFSAKMGFIGFYNRNIGVPPFERFELGGDGLNNQNAGIVGKDIIRLRGYEVEDVEDTNADDAIIFNKFEMELRYPISLNPSSTIYVLGFLEGGNSWNKFRDYNPFELKRAAGLGLRVFLPMFGLLGFDYGFGFDKPDLIASSAPWTRYGKFSLIIGFEPD